MAKRLLGLLLLVLLLPSVVLNSNAQGMTDIGLRSPLSGSAPLDDISHQHADRTLAPTATSFLIGGFDSARGSYGASLQYGAAFSQARSSIGTHFPGATYTSFSTISSAALTGVDVLFLTSVTTNGACITPLTTDEKSALRDYVNDGGCAVLLADNDTFGGSGSDAANESLVDPFEIDVAGTLDNWSAPVSIIDSTASPVTDGPYGTVTSFRQVIPGRLSLLGPHAVSLGTNQLGVAIAEIMPGKLQTGSGRVIVYSDANTFFDTGYSGMFPSSESLFLNTIDSCFSVRSISGYVRDSSNTPIPDVSISIDMGQTTSTDVNGAYSIAGVVSGTYTLTPSKSGYTFSPSSIPVTVPPDATGQDFTGTRTYSVSGRVLQGPTTALGGVRITLSNGQSTISDEQGYYTFSGLPIGTYSITALLDDYVFSPPARSVTISTDTDKRDFWGRTTSPFLDFPADYASTQLSRAFVYGSKGYINSWFDHAYPNYKEPTSNSIRRYDGAIIYEAYGGHNGIDFDDSSADQTTLTQVLAAADGVVMTVYDQCGRNGPGNCPKPLGNHIMIDHQNGYRTIYAHLQKDISPVSGDTVAHGQRLGNIGSTGNSSGPHIHFQVDAYTKNGWQVVDPFQWRPLDKEDPWVTQGGPDSFYLWNWRFEYGETFQTNVGTETSDPAGLVRSIFIAAVSEAGEATATISNPPMPPLTGAMISMGRHFHIALLLLPEDGTSDQRSADTRSPDYAPDLTITIPFETVELLHLDPAQLAIQHYNPIAQQWNSLPTDVDLVSGTAIARTNLTGDFAINAPLLCPADVLEPDDEREEGKPLWPNDAPLARLLDVSEDADWASLSAVEGVQYTLATQNLTGGADTVLRLYDPDGETLLTTDDNSGGGLAALIQWTAPRTGTYFVEIVDGPSGSTGCSAGYELVLTGNPPPRVAHELLTDTLELSWRHDNAAVVQYEVWDSDLPYFAMADGESASKTDVSTGQLGALVAVSESLPTDGGHYYRIRGATAGDTTPASRELGVFTFSLVQGSP